MALKRTSPYSNIPSKKNFFEEGLTLMIKLHLKRILKIRSASAVFCNALCVPASP